MALATAQDYLYTAFRKCGQIRPGYGLSPELLQDGLNEWEIMFDGFNAERTLSYSEPDYVFPITGPGSGTTGNGQSFGGAGYTIGPSGADFIAPRPVRIARMNLYLTSANPSQPSRIPISLISMEEWTNIPVPDLTPINVALTAAYDPQYPNGVIWVWPPLNGNSLEIYTWGQLVPPAVLTAAYSAPPGYADLIIWRLAARLWGMCTKDLYAERRSHQWIVGQAILAAQRVRAMNARRPVLRCDFRGGGGDQSPVCDWDLLLAGVPY